MSMSMPPATPYKGLKGTHTSEDAAIFAARDADAKRCVRVLTGPASVVMLHGRTGCGKSSFLRAALKPLLERIDTGLWFAGTSGTFIVVRSGLTPLRQVAGAIFDLAHDLKDSSNAPHFGDLKQVLLGHQSKEDRTRFIDDCSDSVERMIAVLTALGEEAPGIPILVIDQAEEVFTLGDKVERGTSSGPKPPGESSHAGEDTVRARVDYMNLLRAVAAAPPGVKVLISLRTEYKGLFEDELRRDISPDAGTRLTGFHLNDLDVDGLIAAIEAPQKTGFFRFHFEPGVSREIASRLTDPDAVPMGGVLPTLQVVCSRLYEQTRRSKSRDGQDAWSIQLTDLERLGKLDDQVEVHLRERLEEMFLRLGTGSEIVEIDRTTAIDQWYQLLERLVRLQGDGRAVTQQLPEHELRDIARQLKCRLLDEGALEYLAGDGILRCESRDGTNLWTLGHDSLGLAIQKWAVTYKESLAADDAHGLQFASKGGRAVGETVVSRPRYGAGLGDAGDLSDQRRDRPAVGSPDSRSSPQTRHLSERLGIRFAGPVWCCRRLRDHHACSSPLNGRRFRRRWTGASGPTSRSATCSREMAWSVRWWGLQPLRAVEGDDASTAKGI